MRGKERVVRQRERGVLKIFLASDRKEEGAELRVNTGLETSRGGN